MAPVFLCTVSITVKTNTLHNINVCDDISAEGIGRVEGESLDLKQTLKEQKQFWLGPDEITQQAAKMLNWLTKHQKPQKEYQLIKTNKQQSRFIRYNRRKTLSLATRGADSFSSLMRNSLIFCHLYIQINSTKTFVRMEIQQYLLPSISSRYTVCRSVAVRLSGALQPIPYQRMFLPTIHVEWLTANSDISVYVRETKCFKCKEWTY